MCKRRKQGHSRVKQLGCCGCCGCFRRGVQQCVYVDVIGASIVQCVAEHLGVRLPASPPPLSPRRRRTLCHRGLRKKSAGSGDSTSKWTESEKCPEKKVKKATSDFRVEIRWNFGCSSQRLDPTSINCTCGTSTVFCTV